MTNEMKPLYIFDLDGTLSLTGHRLRLLEDKTDRYRWTKFYAACDKDQPNDPVILTMERLRAAGADIWIFSGRSDEVRDKTIAWLAQYTSFMSWDADAALVMRQAGDYTADNALKQQWLKSMLVDDRQRLVATFDDRDRIVEMWRANGVTCFQVARGDF